MVTCSSITPTTLNLLTTLTKHTNYVYKVIPLTNNRFASCSYDQNIKIWNYSNEEIITQLIFNNQVIERTESINYNNYDIIYNRNSSVHCWTYSKLDNNGNDYSNRMDFWTVYVADRKD